VSLDDAIARAKAELERLRAQEAAALEQSGIRGLVAQLTAENQALTVRRTELRDRLDELGKALAAAKQHGAMVELQIKGAKARVEKLTQAVGARR
jgi:hypothetical protein